VLLLGALPVATRAQEPQSLTATLTRLVDSSRVVGIAIAHLTPDGPVYRSAGVTRAGGTVPVDSLTPMEIGSITKGFTGILLADLVLRGVVSLDDPVARHLPPGWVVPSFAGHQVTLRELATHTSGIPRMPGRFSPVDMTDPYRPMNVDSLRVHVAASPPMRTPGRYEYSNLGMALLGQALAHAGGKPWAEQVRERILEPLGMRATWGDPPAEVEAAMSAGHNLARTPVPRWHFDAYAPAGGLVSSAHELTRLLEALAQPDTTTAIGRAIRLATTGVHQLSERGDSVALAWHIAYPDSTRVVWHNGGTGGFRTWLGVIQGRRRGALALNNATLQWTDGFGLNVLLERLKD
jgi:CubicO group peptidase (beta-lactamase class C family)